MGRVCWADEGGTIDTGENSYKGEKGREMILVKIFFIQLIESKHEWVKRNDWGDLGIIIGFKLRVLNSNQ